MNLSTFRVKPVNENHFLLLSKLSPEEITQIKSRIREYSKANCRNSFCEANAISIVPQLTKASCYLSNLKSTIYYELKNTITNEEARKKIYEVTQKIEIVESITDHLRNLLDVGSGGYGLWQSKAISRISRIENLNFDRAIKENILFVQ